MTYTRRNRVEEEKEACWKAQQITDLCQNFHITLDPIDWQHSGMQARVSVNTIEISDLLDLRRLDGDSLLRRIQLKLFEHTALQAIHAQQGLKALIWCPVDVVQPQAFLSLWIITLETDQRVAVAEYMRDEQRIYEPYILHVNDESQLEALFGPARTGEYQRGDMVALEERERKFSGEIIYILSPSKAPMRRTSATRDYHTIGGKTSLSAPSSARYLVDCHDGFPHIVHQWQITQQLHEDSPLAFEASKADTGRI